MQAINDYVIISKVKEEPKKIAGLEITEKINTENRYIKGKVITVGNLVEGVKNKDVVYYDKHAGHGITYNDALYQVITLQNVALVE